MAGFDHLGAEPPRSGEGDEAALPRRIDADAAPHRPQESRSEFDSLLNDLGFEPNTNENANRNTTDNADPNTTENADPNTTENAVYHSEESGKPRSRWYAAEQAGASGDPGTDSGSANGSSDGGTNAGVGGPGHPRGAGHANRGRPKRRRWPWIVGGTAAIAIAAFALTPTIIDWLSVSVEEADREIALDGDAASSVVVPAGWVLEQRPFAEELVMYTPDGAVAICLSAPEEADGTTADELAQQLAAAQGWEDTTFSVEHAPSGALVVHALRPGTSLSDTKQSGEDSQAGADAEAADSQAPSSEVPDAQAQDAEDTPCADKPVVMLAAVAQDSDTPVAVRIASDGDVSPYLGEIASILSGVSAP